MTAVLVAGALAAHAPAKQPGAPSGAAHVPPGQAKKAQPIAPVVAAAAPAPAIEAAQAKEPKPATSSRETANAKKHANPPGQAKKAEPEAAAAAATAVPAPAPAAAAAPVATPQPATTTAAAPAAPAAPAAQPARRPTSAARPTGTSRRRGAPARRTTGTRPAATATATAAATPAPFRIAPAPAVTPKAAMSQDGGNGTATRTDPASPLTRNVVRVLEVIPTGVKIALAALVLLGLLFGAAAAWQTMRARRLRRQRRLLLADIGLLQSALLPDLPARIGGARVSAAYRPAAGLGAGGDFYDAFELPGGRTGVIVGDVAGHGRDAIPLTALVRYNLRAYLEAGLTPRATLHVGSNVLAPQLGGLQVTVVVAIFDPGTGRLTYACAGHVPPLLLGTSSALVTATSSPPIGAGYPTGRRQTTVALAPGAAACFLTDGLTDVSITPGRRLGRDGLHDELRAVGADADELIARVVRRSETQPDDMAVCILTALPGGAEHWSLQLEELEADDAMLSSRWVEQFLVACGADPPQIGRALTEAREMVGLAGTAIVEVRIGEELLEIRVGPPSAVTMPIARLRTATVVAAADDLAAAG